MGKIFYVCSYGGCGSTMLHQSLKKYGETKHIHSKNPPDKLEFIGKEKGGNAYHEWFNGINIPKIDEYLSRFNFKRITQRIYTQYGWGVLFI